MKIVILYSSGLDSFIMKSLAQKTYPEAEIVCIYYKHGADSEKQELKLLPEYVDIRTIDWLNDRCRPVAKKTSPFVGPIYIPGRNMVFACLAASQELPDQIWMGTLYDECVPTATDKNEPFRQGVSDLISYVLSPFIDSCDVVFPFVDRKWSKVDAVRWALDNGVPQKDILETVSCSFHDGEMGCGVCFQCLKRRLVMLNCGIDVVESYTDPMTNDFGREVISGIVAKVESHPEDCDLDEKNMYSMYMQVTHG